MRTWAVIPDTTGTAIQRARSKYPGGRPGHALLDGMAGALPRAATFAFARVAGFFGVRFRATAFLPARLPALLFAAVRFLPAGFRVTRAVFDREDLFFVVMPPSLPRVRHEVTSSRSARTPRPPPGCSTTSGATPAHRVNPGGCPLGMGLRSLLRWPRPSNGGPRGRQITQVEAARQEAERCRHDTAYCGREDEAAREDRRPAGRSEGPKVGRGTTEIPTVENKTQKPLRVPLPSGKVLHLGPRMTGQITGLPLPSPSLSK